MPSSLEPELSSQTPRRPSFTSSPSDFAGPSRPGSIINNLSATPIPAHLQPQPSYPSSPAQSRDSSPARSASFRRSDRARRSLLNPSGISEDSLKGRIKRWRHGKVSFVHLPPQARRTRKLTACPPLRVSSSFFHPSSRPFRVSSFFSSSTGSEDL